jgi:subtilisin family serine protease
LTGPSAVIMGPPPAAAAVVSSSSDGLLNLVLQPGAGGSLGSLAGLIASAGATVHPVGIPGVYEVQGPPAAMGSLAAQLAASPAVEYAAPPKAVQIADAPNDPSYLNDTQWLLNGTWGINAPGAWSVTVGSSQVIVADSDTGISYNNAELVNNLWINQAEIPSSVRPNLTDTNGDGLITFADLNQPVNQGAGKIVDVNKDGRIDGGDVIAAASSGGWTSGSTSDGDTSHPDAYIGWNFVGNNNNPLDGNGHGTFTAGEIAAAGNNAVGVAGANWSVQLMSVQMMDYTGNGTDAQAVAAIQYAVNHGAKVINASWGGAGVDATIASAIQYADQHGVIIVAAAGNSASNDDNASTWFAPASYSVDYPNLISVAATDFNGGLASWSNYGVHSVQIAAPGVNLYGLSGSGYTTDSGTSMAAPLVTGTVALVEAAHPTWSMTQVVDAVLDTTTLDPLLAGKVKTGGIVNAAAAVANTDGPYVASASPGGAISGGAGLSTIQVTFNEEVNPATFTPAQVALTGPGGAIGGVSVAPVVGSNDHTFAITFPTQSAAGAYTLKVGPNVQDWYGNAMNQDRNGTNGEASDAFVETINQASGGSSDVLLVAGIPAGATAGRSYSFTVTALAPGGGTDTGFLGTINFRSSDPQVAGLPASYTFSSSDNGTHTFSVTFKTAGMQSITATEPSVPSVTGSEGDIRVQPAAAHTLAIQTSGTPTAGVPFAVTVTARDPYGNVATGYVSLLGFSSTDAAAQFPMYYNVSSPPPVLVPATYVVTPEQQGTATFDVTFETPGTQSLTVSDKFSSTLPVTASGLAVQQGSGVTGNPDATATTFANPVGSSTSGQAVTLTATVKATGSGIANPTDGSVSFYQGSTLLGTVNLSGSNQATFTTAPLSVGTFAFFAAYNGDAVTYRPSASPVLAQVVNHFQTNLTLSSSATTAGTGQSVTFTATATVVGPSGSTPPTPTGTVTFYDGTTAMSTVSLNGSNQATWTTSTLIPGSHSIVAVYNGDSLTQMNQSPTLNQTVTPSSQSVVYVNSAWTGDPTGTQVTVGTSTHTIGTDAFATIQGGVDGVAAGGTVNILAGTYSEQVAIGQSLTLAGAGAASTTLNPPLGGVGAQITILGGTAVSVTISGLTLAGSAPFTGVADLDGAVLVVNGTAIGGEGVGLEAANGSKATVSGSSITSDSVGIWDANAGSVAVTQSAITGDGTGILVGNGGGDISTLTAQQGSFAGDAMGIQDIQDPTIYSLKPDVATDNWWGSLTGPTSASNPGGTGVPVAGNVSFTPWIGVYTNGTPSGQPGFTPTVSAYYAVPTQLVFSTEPSSSTEGQVLASQPIVKAEDAGGNLGINFNGLVSLALKAISGSGTLAGTSSLTASNGIASFGGLSISEPGTYTLTASTTSAPWTGLTAGTSSPSTTVADGALTDTTSAQTYSATLGNRLGTNPVVLATFTDANPHAVVSDYAVSVNWGGSATSTSDSLQFVSSTSTSSTWQVVGNATYGAAGTYTVGVNVTDVDLSTNTFTDTHTTVNVNATTTGTASFVKNDTTTQGTWVGAYGAQGYDIEGFAPGLPSYATMNIAGASTYTWAASTTDPRALENPPSGPARSARTWYGSSFTIDMNLGDGQAHDLALYAVDWDNGGRQEQIQVIDPATGKVLDTESLASFSGGAYLQWKVSGHVQIRVTGLAGPNAVVSGLFLDPTGAGTASFVKKDTTTQGTWVGAYGGHGYDVEGFSPGLPSYAAVNLTGASTYTWAASTTDTRALEDPPSGPARSAQTWYGSSFTIDVNLSDGQSHDLALNAVDWDNQGRQEQVQVIDPATGNVLDTETLSSFSGGAYLQWKVSGHVQIRVTRQAGPNAVVSGLFLD